MATVFSCYVACKNGAPGEIRTPDRSVRSRVLYPAELRAHINGGEGGIRTLGTSNGTAP